MGKNNMKKNGFTLLEAIISFAVISIVSVGIYTGYIIMIKQTKDGQVKQKAALEGKKVIEEIQANNFAAPNTDDNIIIDKMQFNKENSYFERYLNDSYEDKESDGTAVNSKKYKYKERITITPTKAGNQSQNINLNTNSNLKLDSNKIYISRLNSEDYIAYWKYDLNNQFDPKADYNKGIPLFSVNNSPKIQLAIYLSPDKNDSSEEDVNILDYMGQTLVSYTKDNSDNNLIINFSNYINDEGTSPNNEKVELNIYNKTSTQCNAYIEKQLDLNIDTEVRKGKVNIYDNRSDSIQQDKLGELYDIKLEVIDKDEKILFTGYYKKNL